MTCVCVRVCRVCAAMPPFFCPGTLARTAAAEATTAVAFAPPVTGLLYAMCACLGRDHDHQRRPREKKMIATAERRTVSTNRSSASRAVCVRGVWLCVGGVGEGTKYPPSLCLSLPVIESVSLFFFSVFLPRANTRSWTHWKEGQHASSVLLPDRHTDSGEQQQGRLHRPRRRTHAFS